MNFRDSGNSVLQLFDRLRSKASRENFCKRSFFRDDKPAESTPPRRFVFFICYSNLNKSHSLQLYFNVGILLQELCTLNSKSMKKENIKNEIH